MNLTINQKGVTLTDDLESLLRQAATDTLERLDAPPQTGVTVDLMRSKRAGLTWFSAEVIIDLPEEPLRVEGFGHGPEEAVASLRGALRRQTQKWKVRHALKPKRSEAPMLKGTHVAEKALREEKLSQPPKDAPDSVSARSPLGSR